MSYDLGTAHGKITLEYEGEREAERAEDDIEKVGRQAKKSDRDVKDFARSLAKAFSVIGKAGAITILTAGLTNGAIQAAALGVQLLGIIPSLVSIASLAGALPALFLAGATAVGVLKAAFAGVGDALGEAIEGDLEKFNEALEKLSPQAREFAIAFKDAVPALKAVQQGIQDAFFSNNLEDMLPRVIGLLQSLAPQLNQVATQFGGMGKQILEVVTSAESIRIVQDAVGLLQQSLINLTPAIRPILEGLRDVARVGTEFLEPFSTGIGDLATRFGLWLSQIANGGQLFSWMTEATSTLATLRDLVLGLGGALTGIFNIAEQTGGGLLNTLAELAQAANEFVNSADGSAAIGAAFTGILEVARQLAPIFTIIAKAILSSLGPALADLAIGLGPILQDAVTRLVPALTPLADAIVQLLLAVAPLLPAVAQIAAVLGVQLANAIAAVANVLGPFIEQFGGMLASAFAEFLPVAVAIGQRALPLMAEAGQQLAEAFAPLAPVFIEFARSLAAELLPHLPALLDAVERLIPPFVQLAGVVAEVLVVGLQALMPILPFLVSTFVGMVTVTSVLAGWLLRLVSLVIQLVSWLPRIPSLLISLGNTMRDAVVNGVTSAWNALSGFRDSVIQFFSELPGRIAGFLSALPGVMFNAFKDAADRALFAVGYGIGLVIKLVTDWPGMIARALSSLGGLVAGIFTSAWNTAVALVRSGVNRVVAVALTLPGRVRGAINAVISFVRNTLTTAWNNAVNAIQSGVNRAVSAARQLPGRVRSALSGLGSTLYSAGRDLIQGLINGMTSLIDRAVSIARNAASRIKDGIASALRIGSPSKVMVQIGKWTIEGLIDGMRSMLNALSRTAGAMAQAAIAPTASYTVSTAGAPVNVTFKPPDPSDGEDGRPGTFGPYIIQLGERTLAAFVIDTISGNPKVVSNAAKEGGRQGAWTNPGRA